MMSSSKFSDKLINSSRKYVSNFMKHPNVVSIFVTGEAQNKEIGIALYWKEMLHLNEFYVQLCRNRCREAQTVEEKAFYEQLGSQFKVVMGELDQDFARRFGQIGARIQSKAIAKSTNDYKQNMLACKTVDEFVIFNFSGYWITAEAANQMRGHPKYKSNLCFDFLYAKDYSAHVNGIKSLLDSIGARVSADEESRLIEFFHRCLQHEIDFLDLV